MILLFLVYLFIIIGVINMIHFALYLIGANLYDIKKFRPKTLSKRRRWVPSRDKPLVSVVIPAYNEEKVIERCLKSVWNNSYENLEIIVVSDGSVDKTPEKVRRFMEIKAKSKAKNGRVKIFKNVLRRKFTRNSAPISRTVRLVEQRNQGKAGALNNGLKNYVKGKLVMMLDADSLLHDKAIERAVVYFNDPNVAGVAANVRIIEELSVLGILQRFEHLVSYRSKKFFTVINCELIIGGVASTYRTDIVKKVGFYDMDTATEDIGLSIKVAARGNKKHKLVYASDVAAMTEGVSTFKALLAQRFRWKLGNLQNMFKFSSLLFSNDKKYTKSLTWYRAPMSFLGEILLLLEPLAFGFVAYVSIKYFTPALIIGAYMTITIYVLLTIWPDEHLNTLNKLKASLFAPMLYFLFYIMNAVQIISAVRCLIQHKKIRHLTLDESTWISPKRTGRKAVSFS